MPRCRGPCSLADRSGRPRRLHHPASQTSVVLCEDPGQERRYPRRPATLRVLDLPTPAALRGRWAAFAATCAGRGRADSCRADAGVWHFDDGGGNRVDLHHLGDRRAVMVGHDHEYSETYFAEDAD